MYVHYVIRTSHAPGGGYAPGFMSHAMTTGLFPPFSEPMAVNLSGTLAVGAALQAGMRMGSFQSMGLVAEASLFVQPALAADLEYGVEIDGHLVGILYGEKAIPAQQQLFVSRVRDEQLVGAHMQGERLLGSHARDERLVPAVALHGEKLLLE